MSVANTPVSPYAEDVRVLIAIDQGMFNEAITARIAEEDGFRPIPLSGPIGNALGGADPLSHDVTLIDFEHASERAPAIIRRLRGLPSPPAVIVFTTSEDLAGAAQCIEAGASGIVTKNASTSELIEAVRWAARGASWISPAILGDVIAHLKQQPDGTRDPRLAKLTARECEILTLVVEGRSRREIATDIYVSIETVRTHLGSILSKLGVHSAMEAAAIGRSAGLRRAA